MIHSYPFNNLMDHEQMKNFIKKLDLTEEEIAFTASRVRPKVLEKDTKE